MIYKNTGYNRRLAENVYQFELVSFFEPEEEWVV
jgi:hypothetical protein